MVENRILRFESTKNKVKRFYCLFIFFLIPTLFYAQEQKKEPEKIKWLSISQAIELNKKNPKKVFMDVYTNRYVRCNVMDSKTFTHPFIIKYVNDNFYAVKINVEENDTALLNGMRFISKL